MKRSFRYLCVCLNAVAKKVVLSQKDAVQNYAVVTVLLSVASVHFYLVVSKDLTKWKGGGFGMFSTVDAGANRAIRIEAISGGRSYNVQLPHDKDLSDATRLSRRLPSTSNLEFVATALANNVWGRRERRSESKLRAESYTSKAGHPLDLEDLDFLRRGWERETLYPYSQNPTRHLSILLVDEIVITVYRLAYDLKTRNLRRDEIHTVSVPGLPIDEVAEKLGLSSEYVAEALIE